MQHTNDADHTDRIIAQGRALVRAIEALGKIESSRPFERELADLLRSACQRCLRYIVADAPSWVCEEILKPGERAQDMQPASQPDTDDTPATLAYPSPATSTAPTVCDLGQDGKMSGDSEASADPRHWTYASDREHAGRKQYDTPTLPTKEKKRNKRTLAI